MIFHPAPLDGVYVVEQERIGDERGFFARTWATEEFAACGLDARAVHMNTSFNAREGTFAGCTFRPHLTRKPNSFAPRAARSGTLPSTSERTRRPTGDGTQWS